MDDLYRDIRRLEMICDESTGLEAFSLAHRTKDLVGYFFTRFIDNIRHRNTLFLHSELAQFHMRYRSQISDILKSENRNLDDYIVPIPKGMIHSYWETLSTLSKLLTDIRADALENDFHTLHLMLTDTTTVEPQRFTVQAFESCKAQIGKLYGTGGLAHTLASKVFPQQGDLANTDTTLLRAVKDNYPRAILLNKGAQEFSEEHDKHASAHPDIPEMNQAIMAMAYRLTIFAVVVDHLQNMEHAFVKVLEIFRRK